MPMNGASLRPSALGVGDQILQHLDQPLHRAFARRLVVGVPPQFGLPHLGLGKIGRLLPARLDHAAADVGAADIDRQNAVMALEDPRRRQMQRADQAGVIGMKADRHQIDLEVLGLEDDVGARDREFADPALPKAAADHDALGIGPGLGLEEAAASHRPVPGRIPRSRCAPGRRRSTSSPTSTSSRSPSC